MTVSHLDDETDQFLSPKMKPMDLDTTTDRLRRRNGTSRISRGMFRCHRSFQFALAFCLVVAMLQFTRVIYQNLDSDKRVSTKDALDCLRKTKHTDPNKVPKSLPYPDDAFEHFVEIHQRLKRYTQGPNHKPHYAAGHNGPWIENYWITYFNQQLSENDNDLSKVFGPYVPILIPWTDIWVKNGKVYPRDFVLQMKFLLRPDVLYITVNQNDDGWPGRSNEFLELQERFHITILSAGGWGHVPIPLLKQPEINRFQVPLDRRNHTFSYVGSKKHAPLDMRERMIALKQVYYYKGPTWRPVMRKSKFSLVPRGYGRTSYHLMETFQLGLIPIHVYLPTDSKGNKELPWIPYENVIKNISYAVTIDELPALLEELSQLSDERIQAMEAHIVSLTDDYFSFQGTLNHISKFMLAPSTSDLVCRALTADSGSTHPDDFENVLDKK